MDSSTCACTELHAFLVCVSLPVGTFTLSSCFLLSRVTRPINAAEDFVKSHSAIFKNILLALFGAGTTTSSSKLSSQCQCILRADMLTFSCRLRGVLHRSLRAGRPEGHRARGSDGRGGGGQIL